MRTLLFTLVAAPLSTAFGGRAAPPPPPVEFDETSIRVERNATDDDTEVVITATGVDEGLRTFRVRAPDGRIVVSARSLDPTTLGQREFAFESPEPPGEAVLAAYPEGVYRFTGATHQGVRLRGSATLSHKLPHPTVILSPADGATVPAGPLLITWSAVPGVEQYLFELENESADPEQTLSFNVPADLTSFEVPPELIAPGAEYQLGIGAVAPNGNIVFVEIAFSTSED